MALTIIDPTNSDNVNREGEFKRLGDTKPGWSASGDATPHSIASSSGGTGTLTFNASQALNESDLLVARSVMIDGTIGKFQSVTTQGENVNLTMDTILARFNTRRVAQSWATRFQATGEIAFPRNQTVTVAGVPRTIGAQLLDVHAADNHAGWIYFFARSQDAIGTFPVVMRFTSAGVFDSAWSPEGGTGADLSGSYGRGFAIDKVNNFIWLTNVVQTGGHYVKKYSMTGTYISQFRPGTGSGVATVTEPSLAVDNSANVYVSGGPSGSVIQKFSNTGTQLAAMGTTSVGGLYDFGAGTVLLAFDGANLIATMTSNANTRAYNTSLVHQAQVSIIFPVAAGPATGLTVDRANEIIYVSAAPFSGGGALRSYSNYGGSYAFRKDLPIRFANRGLAVDGQGRVFVVHNTQPAPFGLTQSSLQLIFDRDGPAKLSVMIHYYMCLALDVSLFDFKYYPSDPTVVFGGWDDNVWEMLKALGAAKGVQYRTSVSSLAGGAYRAVVEVNQTLDTTVTDLDQSIAGSLQISVAMQNPTRTYEIVNQNSSTAPFGDTTVVYSSYVDDQGFSIDVDKTAFTQVTVPHSLVTVNSNPPEVSTWDDNTPGYQVYDSEGLKLPVGTFAQYGGRVQAFLLDANTIGFTINGPFSAIPGYSGPFSFADGGGNGRLNVGGSGVLLNPVSVTMYTGADESYVTDDNGPRIDSPFIENITQVYDRGAWASYELCGPRIELSFEYGPSEGGLYSVGERIRYRHQIWRIMNVTANSYSTQVVATPYTTVGDKDAAWAGQTVAQYDAFWAGYRVYDSKVRPLWRTRP